MFGLSFACRRDGLATRGDTGIFAEETGKILDVAEAHHIRQLLDADIRIGQDLSGSVRFADGDGVLRVQAYPYTERRDVKSYLFVTQEIKARTGYQDWRRRTIEFHTPQNSL